MNATSVAGHSWHAWPSISLKLHFPIWLTPAQDWSIWEKQKLWFSPFDRLLCRKVSNGKMAHRDFPIWPYPAGLSPFAMFLPVPIWPLTVWPAPPTSVKFHSGPYKTACVYSQMASQCLSLQQKWDSDKKANPKSLQKLTLFLNKNDPKWVQPQAI